MRIRTVLLICSLLGAAATAEAQYAPPPPPQPGYYYAPPGLNRGGLVFGGAIGPALIGIGDCGGCDALGALGYQLDIGGMVAPNVAILLDWTDSIHPIEDGNAFSFSVLDVAARLFLGRIFWLEAGLGLANVRVTAEDYYGYTYVDSTAWGFGVMAAAGIEVLQTSNWALDLQLRLAGGHFSNSNDTSVNMSSGAILIGFHWY